MAHSSYKAIIVSDFVAVYAVLALCRGWLVLYVDRVFGFGAAGERHDTLQPGEGLLLLSTYAICVAAAVLFARTVNEKVARKTIRDIVAAGLAAPAAALSFMVFRHSLWRTLNNTIMLSVDAVLLFVVAGAVLGSLIPRGRFQRHDL